MAGATVPDKDTAGPEEPRVAYPRIRRFLQDCNNRAADDALIDALPTAAPPVALALLDVLLARGHAGSLADLIRTSHLLPECVRCRLVNSTTQLAGAVRMAMSDPGSHQRVNAIALIRAGGGARHAYLLATAACDSAEAVSRSAAEALAGLVLDFVEEGPAPADKVPAESDEVGDSQAGPGLPGGDEPYLLEAIRQALDAFRTHRQESIVLAAMQLAGCSQSSFDKLFSGPPGRIFRATLDVFRKSSDPALAGFAYRALASPRWRESIARVLGERARPAFMVGMIRQIHYLSSPDVREGLRMVRKSAWLRNGAAPLLSLPEELMASAVRFYNGLGLPVATKADLMRELILTGPPSIQKPALEALIREGYDTTGRLLRAVVGWSDSVLSPAARRALAARDDFVLPGTLSAEAPSPVRPRRRMDSFDAFWSAFEQLRPAERSSQADAVRRRCERFDENLRFKCRSSKAADRLRAVTVVRALSLQPTLSTEVMKLARDEDRIVRSAAINALGCKPHPVNRRLLMEALQDHDSRVRANAIEVLDRQGYDHELAGLEDALGDANNRVRANLARAFLRVNPQAGYGTLGTMLASPDRSQRISGLWVIREQRLVSGGSTPRELLNKLNEMSHREPDRQIRRCAEAVLAGGPTVAGIPHGFFFEEFPS